MKRFDTCIFFVLVLMCFHHRSTNQLWSNLDYKTCIIFFNVLESLAQVLVKYILVLFPIISFYPPQLYYAFCFFLSIKY